MARLLRITGWKPGLRKVSMTKLLREYAVLDLVTAKRYTDDVVDGHAVQLELPDDERLYVLAHQLRLIGAKVAVSGATSKILDEAFVEWLEEQLSLALQQPIAQEQRLQTVRRFISQLVDHLPDIPPHAHTQLRELLDAWRRYGYIGGIDFSRDETALSMAR